MKINKYQGKPGDRSVAFPICTNETEWKLEIINVDYFLISIEMFYCEIVFIIISYKVKYIEKFKTLYLG